MAYTQYSTQLSNLDSTPPVRGTRGELEAGPLQCVVGTVLFAAGELTSTSTTYDLIRLPSTVVLKRLEIICSAGLDVDATPTLAVDVGAYYSDTDDGTLAANQGTTVTAVDFFAAAVAFGQQVSGTGTITGEKVDTSPLPEDMNLPLWDACGLSSDPGGYIDLVLAVHTAATTESSTPTTIAMKAEFVGA